ncbi:MAG TPA: lytic murein transglycosylase [Baekduia sp.]|uniref:lytic murein transglycosylase n=1 Tax=Baekduia sp. TaxID=2600305 RepID=UPI002D76A0EE|nr:lytic murein transglycosylase [Baekduia sp.]HET6508299.1 lytic murein transglycosylase [Baekduia sp.]
MSAGAFTAGFSAAVFPASAELRTITVTLLGGQTVTVQVDQPADATTPATDTTSTTTATSTPAPTTTQAAPPVSTSTGSTDTGTQTQAPAPPSTDTGSTPPASAPPAASSPAAPSTATPADPASTTTTPADAIPSLSPDGSKPSVSAGGQQSQKTVGKELKKATGEDEASKKQQAEGQPDASAIRQADGVPTSANPTFSQALPGAAAIGVPNFFIDKFRIPPFLLPIYQAAGIEYGVRWEVLAGINEIETDYGRNLSVSSAGALGWMQFMPSTWKQYGVDANHDGKKDPFNPVDAIFAAARYLKAAGADTDIRKAVFAYNHADWYVDSVLMRARLIGGLPSDLVGSLTGLTQGQFPVAAKATYADDLSERDLNKKIALGHNAAMPVEANTSRRGINIYAKAGSPAIATQDGKVVKIGTSKRLGSFIQLEDVYGNTYTYANVKKVAKAYAVPKEEKVSKASVAKELGLPKKDPKPTQAASAGTQPDKRAAAKATDAEAAARTASQVAKAPAKEVVSAAGAADVTKERAFANPSRPASYKHGGEEQLLNREFQAGGTSYQAQFTKVLGLDSKDVQIKKLKVGSKVVAGTILGRLGKTQKHVASHLLFEIRPAGQGAPRIDPKPILDGWKLLESTAVYRAAGKNPFFGPDAKNPSIGQILLMSKASLQKRVLEDPRIQVYDCGKTDIKAGNIDRRVLATLEFLATSGLKPTVSALECGHSLMTTSGNVSEHSSGNAVDIAAINGIPILGHQGEGSITDMTIRRLLTLQGTMKPHQIISLMTFEGADNTLSLPDHADHIHVGFRPLYGSDSKLGRQLNSALKPKQWIKLIDRLGEIDNPKVLTSPSKYAIDDPKTSTDGD